jgi:hypothetical protein
MSFILNDLDAFIAISFLFQNGSRLWSLVETTFRVIPESPLRNSFIRGTETVLQGCKGSLKRRLVIHDRFCSWEENNVVKSHEKGGVSRP